MRDEFSTRIKARLSQRVGARCSNPFCQKLTSGPHEKAESAVNIGVAAHISAAAAGGPRYDASLSSDERISIRNGIWLCQNCAKLIDNDSDRYSSVTLFSWKKSAEEAARAAVETSSSGISAGKPFQVVVEYLGMWVRSVVHPTVFAPSRLSPPPIFWIMNIVLAWLLAVAATLCFQVIVYGPTKLGKILEFHRGSFAFVHILFFISYAVVVIMARSLAALFARITMFRQTEITLEELTKFFLGTTYLDPILCPVAALGILVFDYLNLAGPARFGRISEYAFRYSIMGILLLVSVVNAIAVRRGLLRLLENSGISRAKPGLAGLVEQWGIAIMATISSLAHYAVILLFLYVMVGVN
jgi:hypothetical protein